jgi:hypothetical protein
MGEDVSATVHCYSGSEYAERPTSFEWQGCLVEVELVEMRQRTPDGKRFCVRGRDGRRFGLTYQESDHTWIIHEIEPAGKTPVELKRSQHA